MSRLIDADALREIWVCQPGHDFEPSSFVYSIDNAPTVEPASPWHRVEEPPEENSRVWCAERFHGKWVYYSAYFSKRRIFVKGPRVVHPDCWMPIEPPKEDA